MGYVIGKCMRKFDTKRINVTDRPTWRHFVSSTPSLFAHLSSLHPLPLFFLGLQCHENFFYSGCVILEVHDFRRLPPEVNGGEDVPFAHDYVLLRPNNLNLVCGINGYIAASGMC